MIETKGTAPLLKLVEDNYSQMLLPIPDVASGPIDPGEFNHNSSSYP